MSLPASDDFNRADGGVGTNWTNRVGTWNIFSHEAYGDNGSAATLTLAEWNADSFNADQQGQCVIRGTAAFNPPNSGPALRVSAGAGGGNAYVAAYTISGSFYGAAQILKVVNGSYTSLQSAAYVIAGDLTKLTMSGTTLKAFVNGVQDGADITDSAIASGQVGLHSYSANTSAGLVDDWQGDNLATVPGNFLLVKN